MLYVYIEHSMALLHKPAVSLTEKNETQCAIS